MIVTCSLPSTGNTQNDIVHMKGNQIFGLIPWLSKLRHLSAVDHRTTPNASPSASRNPLAFLSGPLYRIIVPFSVRIISCATFLVHSNHSSTIAYRHLPSSRSDAQHARPLSTSERGVSPAASSHDDNFSVWIRVAGALLGWFRASCAVDWNLPFVCLGCLRGADSHGSASVSWQDCID